MSVIGSNVLAGSAAAAGGGGGATGTVVAVGHTTDPFVSVYDWDSGFGSKYSDPSTKPAGTGRGVAFSPDGNNIVIAHFTSPYVSAYPFSSSGFGSKYSDPSTTPTGNGLAVAFTPDGNDVAITGFGTFKVKRREERKGRNPKTGEEITIKAANAASFKAGKGLKEAINQS